MHIFCSKLQVTMTTGLFPDSLCSSAYFLNLGMIFLFIIFLFRGGGGDVKLDGRDERVSPSGVILLDGGKKIDTPYFFYTRPKKWTRQTPHIPTTLSAHLVYDCNMADHAPPE